MTGHTSEPESATPPSPPGRRRRRWITLTVVAVTMAFGVWIVVAWLPRLLTRNRAAEPAAAVPADAADTRKISATLFYVSEDGSQLIPVSREVPYGTTPGEQARRILEAQIQAPPEGYVSAIPTGTTLRNIYFTPGGEAYADFGPEIVTNHTGGTLDEALAVFAIVNALAVNMPNVTSVQILVDGKEVDALVGHLDLRRPIRRSLAWVQKGQ
jgi:spore germination protein GerM